MGEQIFIGVYVLLVVTHVGGWLYVRLSQKFRNRHA